MFHRLDEDSSGIISKEEIESISEADKQSLCLLTQRQNISEIFDHVDVRGSGELEIDEFCNGVWDLAISKVPLEIKRLEKQVTGMHLEISTMRQILIKWEASHHDCEHEADQRKTNAALHNEKAGSADQLTMDSATVEPVTPTMPPSIEMHDQIHRLVAEFSTNALDRSAMQLADTLLEIVSHLKHQSANKALVKKSAAVDYLAGQGFNLWSHQFDAQRPDSVVHFGENFLPDAPDSRKASPGAALRDIRYPCSSSITRALDPIPSPLTEEVLEQESAEAKLRESL